jgi:GntR family transcriptional repressor for pyruvate dehydrogenase complex
MSVRPVRAPISEAAFNELRDGVTTGRFAPGSQLPSERDLAQRMGVSRSSVREAIRLLVGQGLIEIRPRRGLFVRAAEADELGDAFERLIGTNFDRVLELLDVRRALESRSAYLAAQYATLEDLATLAAIYRDMERDKDTKAFGDDADVRFHCAIAAAAGNTVLTHLMATLHGALARAARLMASRLMETADYRDGIFVLHTRIYEAIRRHDAKGASAAMDAHFAFVQRELIQRRRKRGDA